MAMDSGNKLCRTCLGVGARHIFQPHVQNDEWCSAASINYIADKLCYVLGQSISEHDVLPLWICELCLVQLNLASNFKRKAIESEQKLHDLVGDKQRHAALEINNAITYEKTVSHDTTPASPMLKLEPTADSIDCLGNRSKSTTPESQTLPKIVLVESYSKDPRYNTIGGTSPRAAHLEMTVVKSDLVDPKEDAAFLQSFLNSSPSSLAKRTDKTSRSRMPIQEENKPINLQRTEVQQQTACGDDHNRSFTSLAANDNEAGKNRPRKVPKIVKVLKSLDIDMVAKKPIRQNGSPGYKPSLIDLGDLPIAKKVKFRRTSICVPCYRE